MGWTISYCHQVMARQLGKAYGILPIYGWYQKTYLYHQYSGRVSSPNSQGNKKQGRVPIGYSPWKTCLYIKYNLENIPITIGYYTDKFYSKIYAIEVICHALDFRFEIEEPKSVVSIFKKDSEPVRETRISASKKALKERLDNAKQENNEKH